MRGAVFIRTILIWRTSSADGAKVQLSKIRVTSSDRFSAISQIRFDLIEGRDALVVRNNIADLTASISLRVTGDIELSADFGQNHCQQRHAFLSQRPLRSSARRTCFPAEFSGHRTDYQSAGGIGNQRLSGFRQSDGKLTDTETLNAIFSFKSGFAASRCYFADNDGKFIKYRRRNPDSRAIGHQHGDRNFGRSRLSINL